MSISGFEKEKCNSCHDRKPTCVKCNGDGFLFYINGQQVSKENFRQEYNKALTYQDEYSNDYCIICGRFIKRDSFSVDGLCEHCYHNKQLENEMEKQYEQEEMQRKNAERYHQRELAYQLLRLIAFDRFFKKGLKKSGGTMSFIEFQNITIHVDNIIKVKKSDNSYLFGNDDEKEITYYIRLYTRDGENHDLKFKEESERDKKYESLRQILKDTVGLQKI